MLIPNTLQLGPLEFHLYGLITGVAVCAGAWGFWKLLPYKERNKGWFVAFLITEILVGILFGRLFFVLSHLDDFLIHPGAIFSVWEGGTTIFGVITGGFLAYVFWWLLYFRKQTKTQTSRSFFYITDHMTLVVPLAQGLGRWANYVNQELFGLPTNLPWKMYIAPENRPSEYATYDFFHPTFLYEAILDIISFLILLALFKNKKTRIGNISGLFLINYGIIRILMERLRIDAQPLIGPLKLADLGALVIILLGLIILTISKCNKQKAKRD